MIRDISPPRAAPAAAHAEVHVHDNVGMAGGSKEGEEVLAHRLDPGKLAAQKLGRI